MIQTFVGGSGPTAFTYIVISVHPHGKRTSWMLLIITILQMRKQAQGGGRLAQMWHLKGRELC